jgi:hypothetical protein
LALNFAPEPGRPLGGRDAIEYVHSPPIGPMAFRKAASIRALTDPLDAEQPSGHFPVNLPLTSAYGLPINPTNPGRPDGEAVYLWRSRR